MTDIYLERPDQGFSTIAEGLRTRWARWRAFRKLTSELRTKSDDALRDVGMDPVSRRRMAERAIYGE